MFEKEIEKLNKCMEAQLPVQYEKRIYTVDEIQDILGIGRNAAYDLVKSGVFHSVRIGGSIRISKKSFDRWLDLESDHCQVYKSV
ncbi:MAG: helix-turn-helix domain-containing protein [Clostridia bacterium]|nr:helix-turn-helix domain-containing protein [Clostridia bacterium]